MKIGSNEYKEGTILINTWGYYIDFFLKNISKENFVSLERLGEEDNVKILLYPKFEEIEENYDKIIKSKIIIVLRPHQIEEFKQLSPYFRDQRFKFDRKDFFKFLGLEILTDEELINFSKTEPKFISIYLFLKQFDPYHFNPSYFKAMFNDDNWMYAYPLAYYCFHMEDNKKIKFNNYLENNLNPDNETALKLLFEDFTGISL